MKPRICTDTSVLGGCEDDEFRVASRRLLEAFEGGDLTLVLPELTLRELETAPEGVRMALGRVPAAHVVHRLRALNTLRVRCAHALVESDSNDTELGEEGRWVPRLADEGTTCGRTQGMTSCLTRPLARIRSPRSANARALGRDRGCTSLVGLARSNASLEHTHAIRRAFRKQLTDLAGRQPLSGWEQCLSSRGATVSVWATGMMGNRMAFETPFAC